MHMHITAPLQRTRLGADTGAITTGVGPHHNSSQCVPLWLQKVDNKRTRELSEEELANIRQEVDKYTIEGDLRRFNNLNIKRLRDIGCYRGRRHAAVSWGHCAHHPMHIELLGLLCAHLACLCGIALGGHSGYQSRQHAGSWGLPVCAVLLGLVCATSLSRGGGMLGSSELLFH